MKLNRLTLTVAGLVLSSNPLAQAQVIGQYHFNPANRHHYGLVLFPDRTWTEAQAIAEGLVYHGVNGHLATITSPEEQVFLQNRLVLFPGNNVWIGGFQPAGSPEPAGNWQWVTGEPFSYANWRPSFEPNNNGDENRIELFPDFSWNDVADVDGIIRHPNRNAYLIEFPTPEPSTAMMAALGITAGGAALRRYRVTPCNG